MLLYGCPLASEPTDHMKVECTAHCKHMYMFKIYMHMANMYVHCIHVHGRVKSILTYWCKLVHYAIFYQHIKFYMYLFLVLLITVLF